MTEPSTPSAADRAGAIALTMALAIVAIGLIVVKNRGDGAPIAQAPTPRRTSSSPSPVSPTPPSPSPPPPSPSPPPPPPPPVPKPIGHQSFVALQPDGRLVAVSANNGRVVRQLASFSRPEQGSVIALSPDRMTVYVAVIPPGKNLRTLTCAEEPPILAVAMNEHPTSKVVGRGVRPSVSPDGTRIAYHSRCGDIYDQQALVVLDLASGATRRYENVEEKVSSEPWNLDTHTWHEDSNHIWVVMDWEMDGNLRLLDLNEHGTLFDAERVRTEHTTYHVERSGPSLVYVHQCCYAEGGGQESQIVHRTPDGVEREILIAAPGQTVSAPTVGPAGDLLWVQRGKLFRWMKGKVFRDLGPSTAIARDW